MGAFDPVAYINEPRWQQSRLGLERITELLERMGRPQDCLRFVHVAGTNGKGSTCAYLASVLQASGYRTGLFTSPYVIEFAERIRIDGVNIPHDDLMSVTLFVREHAEAMASESGEHPTEFELMTAVAFEHFARSQCDVVVCEVGLGGRLDSTNIIQDPEVCVITRIGLDHTDFLGDTPAAIAGEKAGIIKPSAPVVSWPQDDEEAMRVIEDAAASCDSQLIVPDFHQLHVQPIVEGGRRAFAYKGREFSTKLLATYQPYNATLAVEALNVLRQRGWGISQGALVRGIADASWPGRFEVVEAGAPPVIVDGGHNPQGAAVLADSLRDVYPDKRVVFVMSVLADKDYRAMIEAVVPLAGAFVCATPPNPRALKAQELADVVRAHGVDAYVSSSFEDALVQARELATPEDVICAFGSLYSIGDIMRAL